MRALPLWLQSSGLQPTWMQTSWLQPINTFLRREMLPQSGIDLGNGRVLGAEDVLEGHYRRMATRRQQALSQPTTHQVAVQVGDNLMVAIAVLAPDLAPLTAVAEQVSGAVPLVEPEERFRQNLHQALERTHRQQAAQRLLGTRSTPRPKTTNLYGWWMVVVGLAATLALVWGWHSRQSNAPAT
jgi:hypothetical protein